MVYLPYIQVILSLLLIGGVLLQRSDASLGSGFGGDGSFGTRFMRRGAEKTLFRATVLVGVLFALSALAPLIVG